MKEADLYVSHGLFDEAREIYQSLLRHFQSQMESTTTPGEQINRVARAGVKILQERLREIDRQFDPFYERPKPSEPPQGAEADLDKETIFNAAVALKEIGLYDEAIQEFKRAAKLRYNVSECYEKIADSLIQKGDFLQGIKAFRALLQSNDISPTQRTSILEKIASAYEATGDKNKALETYQELVNEVKTHTSAFEKVERLTRDLKRFRFSIALVTEHPRISFIVSLLIAVAFMAFLPFVRIVNHADYFTLEHDPDVEFYERFKEVFGNDEFFIIAFEKDDIFTERNLTLLKKITEDLEDIDEIYEVTSLANVEDTVGGPDYFEVRKFLEDIPDDKNSLDKIKGQAVNNPLYVKNLISPDGRTAAIAIQTYHRPDDEDYRKRLLHRTNDILDPYRAEVDQFYLAGRTTTNLSLSQYMKRDTATFIPITYLLIVLAVWLLFRNTRLMLLAVANISACLGATAGLFGLTGITLNNVTTIVLPLVMALALCDTVHIFSHMDKRILTEFPDKRKALASVLKKVVLPCFLTTVTTAVGFLSLAVSKIPPIKEFAYLASAGMVFEFIYSFFLLPPLILLFSPEQLYKDYSTQRGMTSFLNRINGLVQGHSRLIVILSCLSVVSACWFASKIRVETNLLEYFKKESPMRTSVAFVEERLSGVGTLDISLQANQEDTFKYPTNLKVIERIQQHIESLRGVDVTISFVDFMKDMNESFHDEDPSFYRIPQTMEMVSQYLLLYDSDQIEDFVNSSYDHARISVRISEHGSAAQKRLLGKIQDFIGGTQYPNLQIKITGRAVQSVNTIDALVKGQMYSLSLAAVIIGIIMILVFRSIAIGFLSFVPNLFPIILNFGIMGAAGIPLNTATALIAAVAIGIAVDDTIHFLSEYRRERAQDTPIPKALKIVLFLKGRAITSSSLILCIGFGVLVLSRFVPVINFGMLSAIIMMTAVIGDLVVLPAIIMLKAPARYRKETVAGSGW